MNTDNEWEKWGQQDPYFGVITHDKFRRKNLTEDAKREFFESGKEHVDNVLKACRAHIDPAFSPEHILDFGCGTGRLVIPFAKLAKQVVGVDVSESMLKEARNNCHIYKIQNVSLLKSDDSLSSLVGHFDLIHSFIVFQHIPVERGKNLFLNLLNHLSPGGICAVQFTYSKAALQKYFGVAPANRFARTLRKTARQCLRYSIRSVVRLINRPGKTIYHDPHMQMNQYDVNQLLFIVQHSVGAQNMHVAFTDHGGAYGVFLYFQKPALA